MCSPVQSIRYSHMPTLLKCLHQRSVPCHVHRAAYGLVKGCIPLLLFAYSATVPVPCVLFQGQMMMNVLSEEMAILWLSPSEASRNACLGLDRVAHCPCTPCPWTLQLQRRSSFRPIRHVMFQPYNFSSFCYNTFSTLPAEIDALRKHVIFNSLRTSAAAPRSAAWTESVRSPRIRLRRPAWTVICFRASELKRRLILTAFLTQVGFRYRIVRLIHPRIGRRSP